ncbi:restriction endonuclease subunit S [Dolichospermum planctonicum]|uniref:Restriction modification system DNA specificity domain protein n=1 Tax=Dolichospermum planctonicum TaxID=136072 RepID=A0A480AIA8_9CYAN|nr:restriction endonuclease subunit S [Dolichospermum planctonicum]GCL44112.1 restriction modification system DNA specificity domain protein [Dolichospermum planctonicum]
MDKTNFDIEKLWTNIPLHWSLVPLKYLCSQSALYGANIPADAYSENGVRFLRTSDIKEDGTLEPQGVYVSPELVDNYILNTHDLIISRSGTVGRAFVYSDKYEPCAYAGYLVRFIFNSRQSPKYYFYITKSLQFQLWLGTSAIEATIGNVNGEKYANIKLPNPPLSQQIAIANYLDHETVKIDKLISAKERLLDLLTEKRQSLITNVITCGLNPDVPMRDSGIEWIGNIPQHWEVEHLKYHIAKIEQGWSPQCDNFPADEDEWGVLKVGAVNAWEFNPDENKRLPTDLKPLTEYEIKPGDILIS